MQNYSQVKINSVVSQLKYTEYASIYQLQYRKHIEQNAVYNNVICCTERTNKVLHKSAIIIKL